MKTGLTIKAQLLLLMGVLLLMLVGVGALGAYELRVAERRVETLYADRVVPLSQLKKVADMYAVNIVDAAHKAADGAFTLAQALAAVQGARKEIADTWQAYRATRLTGEEAALVARIEPMFKVTDASTDRLESLLKAGDQAGVGEFRAREMYPVFDPLQEVVAGLIQVQLDESQRAYAQAQADSMAVRWTVLASIAAACCVGVALSMWIIGGLVRALGAEPAEVRLVAQTVAQGDLTGNFRLRQGDHDSVMAAMQTMNENLKRIVGTVRSNAESVAAATVQLAQGTQDLAGRTEAQASTLEQTAAAMEQLGTTVQHNADSAQQANQLAHSASEVAGSGGDVVAQVVDTMRDIDTSSQKIADIIAVIDGIAFQTNILALNAAVEAARAGEQGRGFAVVAGEVRSLAQRSAEAAKEIKTLITASVERVSQGTALADRAGATMGQVVDSIRRVTDLVGEISSATREQTQGMAMVSDAVTHMDRDTQQNAALVEESATATQSLSRQAAALVDAVAVFKLGDGLAPRKIVAQARPAQAELPVPRAARAPALAPAAAPSEPQKRQALPVHKSAAVPPPAAKHARLAKPVAEAVADEWESF
ncbi:methyl-accepting chemotaxis protein [Hydrogenophaga aquatica]